MLSLAKRFSIGYKSQMLYNTEMPSFPNSQYCFSRMELDELPVVPIGCPGKISGP